MKLKHLTLALVTLALVEHVNADWLGEAKNFLQESGVKVPASHLTQELKQGLKMSSDLVVNQLGAVNGFNADPNIHIPLPSSLQEVRPLLEKAGLGAVLNDMETRLNRAAEAATPKAKAIFFNAISTMPANDARNILAGSNDAATRYLQSKITPDLVKELTPIVHASLAESGAIQSYDRIMNQYKQIPFAPAVKSDLSNYVVAKGMDGIFYYLAVEEAKIRTDPVTRAAELLEQAFTQ